MTEQTPAATTDPVLNQRVTAKEFLAWFTPDVESEAHYSEANSEDEDGLRTVGDYLSDLSARIERMLTGDVEDLNPVLPETDEALVPVSAAAAAGRATFLAGYLESQFEDYEGFEFRAVAGDVPTVDLFLDDTETPGADVRIIWASPMSATIVYEPDTRAAREDVTASSTDSIPSVIAGVLRPVYFA